MTSRSIARLQLALLGLTPLFLAGCRGPTLADRLRDPLAFGCCGLVILILNILALVEIIQSGKDTGTKVIWIVVIFFLPVLGLIIYYIFGR